jgi:nucleoside-diphosphate-sugar epimerase
MRIFMTGGNGFIGSHVVRELVGQDHDVTCLVRRTSSLDNLTSVPVTFTYGDITDGDTLNEQINGYEAVVHIAARADDWSRLADCYHVNVEGTMNVLHACRKKGIARVIVTGSISSYGEENSSVEKDESWPDNSHYHYLFDRFFSSRMNHYRDSKAMATRKAVAFARHHSMNMIVIEPGFVYGEREFSSGFYEYVKSAQSGLPVVPGSVRNNFPVLYAGDLAKAYMSALTSDVSGVHRIIVTNSPTDNMRKVFSLFCRYAGCKQPLPLPKPVIYIPALFMELTATFAGSRNAPLLTRGRCNMFYDNVMFSAEKAWRLLGFEASTTLEKGIEKTVKWYRDNSFL